MGYGDRFVREAWGQRVVGRCGGGGVGVGYGDRFVRESVHCIFKLGLWP